MKNKIIYSILVVIFLLMCFTSAAAGPVVLKGVSYDANTGIIYPTNITEIHKGNIVAPNLLDLRNVKYWGAKGDGITDDTIAISNAIVNLGANGGVVYIPTGIYLVKSLDVTVKSNVWIHGDGFGTIIKPLENGYPIFDLIGSSYCRVSDLSIRTNSSILPSCAFLTGRTNSENAGHNSFERLEVFANYGIASFYAKASEINIYEKLRFVSPGVVPNAFAQFYSAKSSTNIFSSPITSKFQPIDGSGTGGNSVNMFRECTFQMSNLHQDSVPFVLEYAASTRIENCFFYTAHGISNVIVMREKCWGVTFEHCQMEYDYITFPTSGIFISDTQDYSGISIRGSQIFPLRAVNGSKILGLVWEDNNMLGSSGQFILDVDTLRDSRIDHYVTSTNRGMVLQPQWKIRTESSGNRISGIHFPFLVDYATNMLIKAGTNGLVSIPGITNVPWSALQNNSSTVIVTNNRVGINTNPAQPFHIRSDQNSMAYVQLENVNAGNAAGQGFMLYDGNQQGGLYLYGTNKTTWPGVLKLRSETAVTNGITLESSAQSSIKFNIGTDAEAARIAAYTGFLGLGTNNPISRLHVNGSIMIESNILDKSNVKYWGAKGDTNTDDTIALNKAFRYAETNGNSVYFPFGTYLITNTVIIRSSCDASLATLRTTTTTNPAVQLGDVDIGGTSEISYKTFRLPAVDIATTNYLLNSIGVNLGRLQYCHIYMGATTRFTKGINCSLDGAAGYFAWNTIYLSFHYGHNIAVNIQPTNTAWVNQNTWLGGELSCLRIGVTMDGSIGVNIDGSGTTAPPDNNVFINTSIEGPWMWDINISGQYNSFQSARIEHIGTDSTVRFFGPSSTVGNKVQIAAAYPYNPVFIQTNTVGNSVELNDHTILDASPKLAAFPMLSMRRLNSDTQPTLAVYDNTIDPYNQKTNWSTALFPEGITFRDKGSDPITLHRSVGGLSLNGYSYFNSNVFIGVAKQLRVIPDYSGINEIPAGAAIAGSSTTSGNGVTLIPDASGTTGTKVVIGYKGVTYHSALEIENTGTDYGNLLLMKSGGDVWAGGGLYVGLHRQLRVVPDYAGAGEIPAGIILTGTSTTNQDGVTIMSGLAGTAQGKVQIAYKGTGFYSAVEITNVASGYGNLLLMKSGGKVGIGTAVPSSTLHINGSLLVDGNATNTITLNGITWFTGSTSAPTFAAANGSIYLSSLGEMWLMATNWLRK